MLRKLRSNVKNVYGSKDLSSQKQMQELLERKYCKIMGRPKAKSGFHLFETPDESIPDYYVVLYHDDFDGLLSAAFFGLRAVPALKLDPDNVAYYPINYRKQLDIRGIEAIIKKKKKLKEIRLNLIFLDFNVSSPNALRNFNQKKYPVMMVIDHHSAHPSDFLTCSMVIHDATRYSCTELVCDTFPIPNKAEKAKQVTALLHAVRVIDSGGLFGGYDELYKQMTTEPGCFTMLSITSKLESSEALMLMVDYITGTLTSEEKKFMASLKTKAAKVFSEDIHSFKTIEVPGKPKVVWYRFRNNETEHFLYASACLRAATSMDGDIFFFVLEPESGQNVNYTHKISVRSRLPNVKIHEFCKSYGGGGRPTRAGAYYLNLKKSKQLEEHISEASSRVVSDDYFDERRRDVRHYDT